jgi:hypothetical protein
MGHRSTGLQSPVRLPSNAAVGVRRVRRKLTRIWAGRWRLPRSWPRRGASASHRRRARSGPPVRAPAGEAACEWTRLRLATGPRRSTRHLRHPMRSGPLRSVSGSPREAGSLRRSHQLSAHREALLTARIVLLALFGQNRTAVLPMSGMPLQKENEKDWKIRCAQAKAYESQGRRFPS